MHIGTCVNLVQFLSHYFQFLKILVLHSLLSLTGCRVLIGVGNGVGYLIWLLVSHFGIIICSRTHRVCIFTTLIKIFSV